MGIRNWFQPARKKENEGKAVSHLFAEKALGNLEMVLDMLEEADLVLQRLQIDRKTLQVLEYDDEISGSLDTRRESVVSVPWRLESSGFVSDFIMGEIEPHIDQLLRSIWSAIPYGYSVQEVVYKKKLDGKIGIDRIIDKPIEWFKPQRNGNLIWFPSDGSGGPEGILLDTELKFLFTARQPTYRNPSGEALLSRLYPVWFLRKQGFQFWVQFLERSGMPILIGKTLGDDQALKNLANQLARSVQGASIAIRDTDDIQVIPPGGSGEAFRHFEVAISKRIHKLILGQTLTTDTNGTGSYATAKVHNEVKMNRRNSDIRLVIRTVQHLVTGLTILNFPQSVQAPIFTMEDNQGISLERSERDLNLHQMGMKFTPEYFMDKYELQKNHFIMNFDRKKMVEQNKTNGETTKEASGSHKLSSKQMMFAKNFKKKPPFSLEQKQVEELINSSLNELPELFSKEVLQKIIKNAKNPNDLVDQLTKLADNHDSDSFIDLIERALFTADILGYGQIEKKGEI